MSNYFLVTRFFVASNKKESLLKNREVLYVSLLTFDLVSVCSIVTVMYVIFHNEGGFCTKRRDPLSFKP